MVNCKDLSDLLCTHPPPILLLQIQTWHWSEREESASSSWRLIHRSWTSIFFCVRRTYPSNQWSTGWWNQWSFPILDSCIDGTRRHLDSLLCRPVRSRWSLCRLSSLFFWLQGSECNTPQHDLWASCSQTRKRSKHSSSFALRVFSIWLDSHPYDRPSADSHPCLYRVLYASWCRLSIRPSYSHLSWLSHSSWLRLLDRMLEGSILTCLGISTHYLSISKKLMINFLI